MMIKIDRTKAAPKPITNAFDAVQQSEAPLPEFVGPRVNLALIEKYGLNKPLEKIKTPTGETVVKVSEDVLSLTSSTRAAYGPE